MKILDAIGGTPIVRLSGSPQSAAVLVKLERFNAGGSIKARVASRMVDAAREAGRLRPGTTLIEPTGGNTGIGLALAAIAYGYHFLAVVPDTYSPSRIRLLRNYGATVMLSDSATGNDSHIVRARELLAEVPGSVYLDQFTNPACVDAHYFGTASEILRVCTPDVFVCSVGSGATFTGIARRLKEENDAVSLHVVQPKGCDILSGTAVPHAIQGTALGIRPPLLDYDLINDTHEVAWDEVVAELRALMYTDGLHLGPSSGANILAAKRLAATLSPSKIVLTVAPDGGEHYPEIYN